MDFFGGTGTVAAVAVKNDRQFIHIDSSIEYNQIARKRIEYAFDEKNDGITIFS
jgi:DNA modification methylase